MFISLTCSLILPKIYPVLVADEIVITYGLKPFDICSQNPELWKYIKVLYIVTFIFSNIVVSGLIYKIIIPIKKNKQKHENKIPDQKELNLLIGEDAKTKEKIYVPRSGLYQNFLITGTIGSGKTSSAMYPFTEQLMKYNSLNPDKKMGMLILDVKGNYYKQVNEYAKKYGLLNDLKVIELGGKETYNPLHKPNLKPSIIANRLKTILELFSENNSESYWLDKVEQILTEGIKLIRLYNNGYVTFEELHKIITIDGYYKGKINILKDLFVKKRFSLNQVYELNTALEFFQTEFEKLDQRTSAILKSEITRMTNTFISDYDVKKTFCPLKHELTFKGFREIIEEGKIVVLNMNIAEYRNLSKIIAAYLKLDFQTEVMQSLARDIRRTTAFICDEYAEYVTKTDSDFFSLSREAKCINIVSTQSYSSLKNTLKDDTAVKVICQNLINKIWFRTDDIYTIDEAQKQLGKEDKIKTSKNISENAKETNYNYITKTFNSQNASISESLNVYTQNDYIYDTNFFTQELETFTTLSFLSDGSRIIKPKKLKMFPYFLNK